MSAVLIWGVSSWLIAAFLAFGLMRKLVLNFLDPVMVQMGFLPFVASLVTVLCYTGRIEWSVLLILVISFAGYMIGMRMVGVFQDNEQFRETLKAVLERLRYREMTFILFLTLAFTAVLAALGILQGASGDARQEFGRMFRPLVLLQSGFFNLSLIALLSDKFSVAKKALWIAALMVLMLPFSGKAVFIPVIFWFGLSMFLAGRRLSLRKAIVPALLVLAGAGVVAGSSYGVSGLGGAVTLIGIRLWMSGDVYIYAYDGGALDSIRQYYDVSFLSYVLHPLTSLVGIRAYDKPLGSMLASEFTGTDILTGPNPLLPVLLDFFLPNRLFAMAVVAVCYGVVSYSFRPIASRFALRRSRYLGLGLLAAGYFCPSAGFFDFSQVLIVFVGIFAATAICVGCELMGDLARKSQDELFAK